MTFCIWYLIRITIVKLKLLFSCVHSTFRGINCVYAMRENDCSMYESIINCMLPYPLVAVKLCFQCTHRTLRTWIFNNFLDHHFNASTSKLTSFTSISLISSSLCTLKFRCFAVVYIYERYHSSRGHSQMTSSNFGEFFTPSHSVIVLQIFLTKYKSTIIHPTLVKAP